MAPEESQLNDHSSQEQADHEGASSLIAMAGTLVPVDRQGNEINANGNANSTSSVNDKTLPQKRASTSSTDPNAELPITPKQPPKKKSKGANGTTTSPTKTNPTSSKKKPVVKTEHLDSGSDYELKTPTTPSPKKRSPTKKNAADSESVSPTKSSDSGLTVRDTPRKRAAPRGNLAAPRGIPTSWDNADAADKLLVTMKDAGESWAAIREAWKKETGQDTAGSTLPNRYNRIKVNMMHLKPGDQIHLLNAKLEVEAEMWAFVASKMEKRGADKYPTAFLQKKFKEFEEQAQVKGVGVEVFVEGMGMGNGKVGGKGDGGLVTPEEEEEDGLSGLDGRGIDQFVEKEGE